MLKKLTLVLLALFVLTAIAYWIWPPQPDPSVPALVFDVPKPAIEPVDFLPSAAQSKIFLPVQVPLDVLQQKLESELERRVEGQEKDVAGNLLRNDTLTWYLDRADTVLTEKNAKLDLTVPYSGRARLEGLALVAEVSTHADLVADLLLQLQPTVNAQWRLEPNWTGEISVHSAKVRVLNQGISIKDKISKQANKALQKSLQRQAEKLLASEKLAVAAHKCWVAMHSVRQISEAPVAWLQIVPTAVSLQQFYVTPQGLNFGLGLDLNTQALVQRQAPVLQLGELPTPLFSEVAGPQLELSLLTALRFEDLETLWQPELDTAVYRNNLGSLTLKSLHMESSGRRILLTLNLGIQIGPQRGETTVYLWAEPQLEGSQLRFSGLDFSARTGFVTLDNLLHLSRPLLLENLQKRLHYDLSKQLEEAQAQADLALQGLLTDLPPRSNLKGRVASVSLQNLGLSRDYLYVNIRALAELEGQIVLGEI